MRLEKIEDIKSFDNKNFVHPWEYMKDVAVSYTHLTLPTKA